MGLLTESFRQSNIGLDNISKSLSSTQKSVSVANSSIDNISKIISNNTRIKKDLFEKSLLIQSRRDEASRRKEREDELESSKVSTNPVEAKSFTSRSGKGPLGRLFGFLGFLTAGWIVENLPTWIFMGKEFISRIYKFGDSMVNMVNGTFSIFNSIGAVISNSFSSLVSLDFNEFTEGSVAKSFEDLNNSVKDLGANITDTFKLFTTPLTESIDTGEQAPDLGEDRQETMFPSPTGGVTTSGYGTKEQQALLKTIRFAEGTAGPTGYSMFYGDPSGKAKYGDITKLSANEVEKLVTRFLQDPQSRSGGQHSAAVGAYQIIDITSKARALGMDMNRKFDQSFQDELALRLAASRGVTAEVLRREGLSDAVIKKLSPEWASFPGNTYNQPTKRIQDLKSTYQQSLSSQTPSTTSTSTTSGSITVQSAPVVVTSGFGWRWGRQHQGIDLAPKTGKVEGTPVIIKKGGTVVYAYIGSGNMGMVLITHDDGTQSRYLHVNNFKVKKGQKVQSGQTIAHLSGMGATGIGNATGPHLHFEYYASTTAPPSDPVGVYQKYVSLGGKVVGSPPKPLDPTQPSRPPEAQLSPPPQSQQPSTTITPERRGSQVMIIDDTRPTQPQVSYSPSQQQSYTPTISEFKLLNNFIKNKLLLDLAYL